MNLASARIRKHVTELRRRGVYLTGPRRSVLEILCGLHGHVTMMEILAEVRRSAPRVSSATVYRTMRLLVDADLVRERRFRGRSVWFEMDGRRGDRDQLVCNRCGEVVEFEDEGFSELRRRVAVERGFDVVTEPCTLLGICPRCALRQDATPSAETGCQRSPRLNRVSVRS